MKVKIKVNCFNGHLGRSIDVGEVVELPQDIAEDFIHADWAEVFEEPKTIVEQVTEVVEKVKPKVKRVKKGEE